MRIALCLSGHFRSFEQALPTLKRAIIIPYNPDIFIFTWNTVGFDGVRGDRREIRQHINPRRLDQLYNPKKQVIEPLKQFDTIKYNKRLGSGLRKPSNVNGMYYSIFRANQLKIEYENENNFVYDVVIRGRADLNFDNILPLFELERCKISQCIYFPKFGDYGGYNDQFCFGSSNSMDLYAETFLHLDEFFEMGCRWHAESMAKFAIDYFEIPIYRSEIKYTILRANGEIFKNA
jgi:hypothetical protein